MAQARRFALAGALLTTGLALSSGCSTTHAVERDWVVATTKHFRVVSSAGASEAEAYARKLEQFHQVVAGLADEGEAAGAARGSSVPLTLYAFGNRAHYEQFAPRHTAGAFMQGLEDRFVVVDASSGFGTTAVFFHEYVHAVLAASKARYPPWYHEGLAQFLQTARLEGNTIELGRPPVHQGILLAVKGGATVSETGSHLRRRPLDFEQVADFYARAWATVDYLTLGHLATSGGSDRRPGLLALLRHWSAGAGDEAYPKSLGMTREALEGEVDAFLRRGEFPLAKVPLELSAAEVAVETSALRSSRVARELGDVLRWQGDCPRAFELYQFALKREPSSVHARLGRARCLSDSGQHAQAEQELRALEGEASDSLLLAVHWARHTQRLIKRPEAGEAATLTPERIEALNTAARQRLERALAAHGPSAEALALLGYTYLLSGGNLRPGVEALESAVQLAPGQPEIELWLGQLLLRSGRREAARLQFERVAQLGPHVPEAETAVKLLKALGGAETPRSLAAP